MTDPTGREREVFEAFLRQRSAKGAAEELGITRRTVQDHLKNLYAKIGADGHLEAAELLGYLQVPPARRTQVPR